MVIIIFYQVIARYVFNNPPKWSEEIALLLMIWITLLVAGIELRKGIHMRVELFINLFTEKINKILDTVVYLIIAYYSLMMVKYSYLLSIRLPNKMPATGIPVLWMYIPASVCGILLFFNVVVKFLIDITDKFRRKKT